ncbi:alpha/beta hydrolase [Mesobacillus maritimus]|uniref:Carbohydrate esterase n=1 Tax=Mesobacillus maritimus TaxID=1643336 RepID=A0ABS7K864_9BACI|nr:alpha/beta hydrolase-fold protein [Mesobacillus maritimus]MBY0098454.1 hypothetical protein [Mesobacillus maritimus]
MMDSFKVNLTPFNRERTIRVYLPTNYDSSHQRYPVLYMHDGQYLFRDEDTKLGGSWRIEDYLNKSEYEVIIVGIDCADGLLRIEEYGPWENHFIRERIDGVKGTVGGKGELYVDYIVNELKPIIDDKYRTIKEDAAMAGSSMGGLITFLRHANTRIFLKKLHVCLLHFGLTKKN